MEGGIQSAGEALAGQDARILWISVARTGGMFLKRGPKWGGSEKLGGWDGGQHSCYGRFKVINFRHKIVRERATQATVLLVGSSPICSVRVK